MWFANLKSRMIKLAIYIYIALPFFIFISEWTKWYWALLGGTTFLYCIYLCIRNDTLDYGIILSKKKDTKILILAFCVILFWVYLSGIGGLCYQNSDHGIRNTIYEALTAYQWPVTSKDGMNGLIYYFGFWLPSAIIGKLFGFEIGYHFQIIWATLGIFIVFYLICFWRKKVSLWPLLIMIFFSGLDYAGVWLLGRSGTDLALAEHLEWWAVNFQYSSFTTQLFWVFNQAVPAWVTTMLILINKNNKRNMLFVLGCTLLTSTFSFVGLVPFVIFFLINGMRLKKEDIKNELKEIITPQNIVGVCVAGIISFLFLFGNISSSNIGSDTSEQIPLLKYILFYFFEFGIYMLFIYRYQKKNLLFYITLIVLLLCPLIKVGYGHDFCMRASIPALFIVMIFCIDTLEKLSVEKSRLIIPFLIVFCIGAITPFNEMHRSINQTVRLMESEKTVIYPTINVEELLKGKNFSGEIKGNIFWEFFAKPHS